MIEDNTTWEIVDDEDRYQIEDNGTALLVTIADKIIPDYEDFDYRNECGAKLDLNYEIEENNDFVNRGRAEMESTFITNLSGGQRSSLGLDGDVKEKKPSDR